MTATLQPIIQNQPQENTLTLPPNPASQNLPQAPNPAPTPSVAPAQGRLSFQNYIDEARRLGQESLAATSGLVKKQAELAGDTLSRKLYGQNIGLESGLGGKVVQDTLKPILEQQQFKANEIGAQLSMDALNKYYDQDKTRLSNILDLVRSGDYALNDDDKQFLAQQGYGGQLQSSAKTQLAQTYGKNPDTGQDFGSDAEAKFYWTQKGVNTDLINTYGLNPNTGHPFGSTKQAEDFWQSQGFNRDILQKYGINPETGHPFGSEQEAVAYTTSKNNLTQVQQQIALKYGLKSDGTPFNSEQEAQNYWNQKSIQSRYGNRPDGSAFGSEEEALQHWADQGFNKKIVQKYGMAPNGMPWPSEQAALDYIAKQGFNTQLAQKYGIKPDGSFFTSELDAQQFVADKELADLKKNITDPAVRDLINTKDEWNYYLENGRTYEDEVAEIIRTSKSLNDWVSKLPNLYKALGDWQAKIDSEMRKGNGWVEALFGGGRDQGRIDHYKQQYEILNQAINEINGGKIPVLSDYELIQAANAADGAQNGGIQNSPLFGAIHF